MSAPVPRTRFVILGQQASASPAFSLLDLPGTSGRLDVLLRCVRAALLVSHGLRRDTIVYLVLMGGENAPRTLRIDGMEIRFVRPDERSLALLVQKALLRAEPDALDGAFVTIRDGLALARGGLEAVLADVGASASYVLEEDGQDIRSGVLDGASRGDALFFVGDKDGFDDASRARIAARGAAAIAVGPVSLHADDAITILQNELDRERARERPSEQP